MRRFLTPLTLLLTAACLDTSAADIGTVLDIDFNATGDGFVAGAADFPASQAAAVGAVGDFRLLPENLSTTDKGLYLSGTVVGGDLFLFQKRRFTNLPPARPYQVTISVGYVTDYHSGCTAGPGELTVIKAGVTATEPLVVTDAQGVLRMNIDKGVGVSKGLFTQAGDLENGLPLCPAIGTFASRATLAQSQTTPLVTDAEGGFWLYVGTQSSFAGAHRIYFYAVRLTLK
jgi:hypothetical protein